jgi:hypothetical protein
MRTQTLVTTGFALLIAATVATDGLVARNSPVVDRAASELNTLYVQGYGLDNSPQAAASFPANDIVVISEVESALDPQWSGGRTSDAATFIFTPIRIRVLEVLRGSPRLQGGGMIVRRLGGRIGDTEYVFSEEMAPAGLEPGNVAVLFLGAQRDLGDGYDAATPNMLYMIDTQGRARSSDGRWTIDLASFRELLGR